LVVQARQADHEVVRALVNGRPALVADAENERRRAIGFPPFGAVAELSGDEPAVLATIDAISGFDALRVIGPTDGKALVVAPDADVLADALAVGHAAARPVGRVRTAVDPPRV
jgi:primosomal protein N'